MDIMIRAATTPYILNDHNGGTEIESAKVCVCACVWWINVISAGIAQNNGIMPFTHLSFACSRTFLAHYFVWKFIHCFIRSLFATSCSVKQKEIYHSPSVRVVRYFSSSIRYVRGEMVSERASEWMPIDWLIEKASQQASNRASEKEIDLFRVDKKLAIS